MLDPVAADGGLSVGGAVHAGVEERLAGGAGKVRTLEEALGSATRHSLEAVGMPALPNRRRAKIVLDGWAGRTEQEVWVVGETAKRYRIEAIAKTGLAGRQRSLMPGEQALVPKHAVRFEVVEVESVGMDKG